MIYDYEKCIIHIKIVYIGPALSGKTETIKSLFRSLQDQKPILSIDSSIRRTLVFDYGTLLIQGNVWNIKYHIYTTPGFMGHAITRSVTLNASDGLIFVADSQESAYCRNLESWNELTSFYGSSLRTFPLVIAFNKQDLPDKFSSEEMLEHINFSKLKKADTMKTVAIHGEGVCESIMVLLDLIAQKMVYLQSNEHAKIREQLLWVDTNKYKTLDKF